jgi:hypothetical protein
MANAYAPGDFSWWNSRDDAELCDTAYRAVTKCELWGWLKDYYLPNGTSYVMASCMVPELLMLADDLEEDQHSGSTMNWTLFQMHQCARLGWDEYVSRSLAGLRQATPR